MHYVKEIVYLKRLKLINAHLSFIGKLRYEKSKENNMIEAFLRTLKRN